MKRWNILTSSVQQIHPAVRLLNSFLVFWENYCLFISRNLHCSGTRLRDFLLQHSVYGFSFCALYSYLCILALCKNATQFLGENIAAWKLNMNQSDAKKVEGKGTYLLGFLLINTNFSVDMCMRTTEWQNCTHKMCTHTVTKLCRTCYSCYLNTFHFRA